MEFNLNAVGQESDSLDDTYLAHYGVKGMKWGQWNPETQRKYSGGLGRASNAMKGKLSNAGSSITSGAKFASNIVGRKISSIAGSAKASTAKKISEHRALKAYKKEQKKELNDQRKELGMSRKKYDKLRERTLKSHDPRVIEKGMHTLTDDELNAKINRLQREEMIGKMATSLSVRNANERKAKSEAFNSNILVRMGKQYADQYVQGRINQILGSKDSLRKAQEAYEDLSNKYEDLERTNRGLNSKLNEERAKANARNKSTPNSQYSNAFPYGSQRVTNSSASSNPYSSQVRTNFTRSVLTGSVSSPNAQASAKKGKSYVDSNIYEAKVSNVGSSRYSESVAKGKKWYDLEGKTVIDNDDIPKPKKSKGNS